MLHIEPMLFTSNLLQICQSKHFDISRNPDFFQNYHIMRLPFNLMWNNLNLETYKQKIRKIVFCNIFKFYWAWILSCGHPRSDYKIFCKKCWLLQFFLRDAKRSWNAIFTIRCTKITTKEKDHSNWGKEIWNRFNHTLSWRKTRVLFPLSSMFQNHLLLYIVT